MTKRKIRALVKQMRYEPDHVARSLATGRSNLIGVMVTDSTNPYYADVIRGIEDGAREANYHVVLANGSFDLQLEAGRIQEMMRLRVAGIVAAPAFGSEKPSLARFWQELRRSRFPFVLVNRQLKPPIFHQVSADNVEGVRLAVEALASLGHRRVAYISGKPAVVPIRQRLAAFRRFARKYGLHNDPELFECCELGSRGGYEACRRLWSKLRNRPTAVMALSDAEAFGVLRYFREHDVKVPEEVSVIGFDGFEAGEFSHVSLSTVSTPMRQIGREAVKLLIGIIEKRIQTRQTVIWPAKLELRESVGPVSLPSRTEESAPPSTWIKVPRGIV
jgi:LacI family transcriptional regulator